MAKFPKITTPKGRFAYAWLQKPDEGGEYSDGKYKVTVLFTPDQDFEDRLTQLAEQALQDKYGRVPKNYTLPLKDGDEKTDKDGNPREEYAGMAYILAKSKYRPATVDAQVKPVPEGTFGMSGDVGRLSLVLVPYKSGSTFGVSAQLRGVQILEKNSNGSGSVSDDFEVDEGFSAADSPTTQAGDDDDGDF